MKDKMPLGIDRFQKLRNGTAPSGRMREYEELS